MVAIPQSVAQTGQPKLASGALGLTNQLFQSITHMAPAAGIVFSVQYMASKGGGSISLAFILAMVAVMLTAFCLREVVRKVRSAGGYFVIHSVALGHTVGFTTSWLWFLDEGLNAVGLALIFPYFFADFLNTYVGLAVPWWIISIVMILGLAYLSYVGVRESSQVTVWLGSIEIAIMLLLGVILIVKAGSNQPLVSFTPAASPEHWGGVAFAIVFGILAFLGFESGVPLAEESNNPKRSLTIAIMASTLGIGLFYCLLGYATVAGWGFSDPQTFADDFSNATSPYYTLGAKAFGAIGPLLVLLAIANSSIACSIAGTNAVTRVYYSLGRAGVFPKWLDHINPRTQTPDRAIFLSTGITLFFAMLLGFYFGPFLAFGLLGLLFTIVLMIIYGLTNLSCFVLYWTRFRDEFNVVKHLIIPLVGGIVLLFPLIASLAPQLIFGFSNDYPFYLGLPITLVWFLIGVVVYLYLRARRPQQLDVMANEMARVDLAGEEFNLRDRAVVEAPTTTPTSDS
ncbi:MAG: APC family permease [Chloroflexi bacterium]|nr:APC family permease [Chloroflexota bacterium]